MLIDGRSAAQLAIEAGAGTEYTYDSPYDGRSDYLVAQDRAQDIGAGLWSVCA